MTFPTQLITTITNYEQITEVENQVQQIKIKIMDKIKNKLNLFDKLLFWLNNKIEANLKKKIEVKFPMRSTGQITVKIYNDEYTV